MKSWVKDIALYALSLYLTSLLLSGVKISGGFWILATSGIVLSILRLVLYPILTIITLPLHFLSLGFFSVVINAVVLYVLTIIVPEISIRAFTFQGAKLAGFIIPKMQFNIFFAFLAASIVFSLCHNAVVWLIKE